MDTFRIRHITRSKKADPAAYMREYMRERRAKEAAARPAKPKAPPKRNSEKIIADVLDDASVVLQLSSMAREQARQHLFIRMNLEPHEVAAILARVFPA